MARLARDCARAKPWKAEVRHFYKTRFLGYFATQDEAEQVERDMRLKLTGHAETQLGWEKGRR